MLLLPDNDSDAGSFCLPNETKLTASEGVEDRRVCWFLIVTNVVDMVDC